MAIHHCVPLPFSHSGGTDMSLLVTALLFLLLVVFAAHCTWVTSNAYSSPSVVLATTVRACLCVRVCTCCVFTCARAES